VSWIRPIAPSGQGVSILGSTAVGSVHGGGIAATSPYTGSGHLVSTANGLHYTEPSAHQVRRISPDGIVGELAGWYAPSPPTDWRANPLYNALNDAKSPDPLMVAPGGWPERRTSLVYMGRAADAAGGAARIERLLDATPYEVALGDVVHVLDGAGRHTFTKSRERPRALGAHRRTPLARRWVVPKACG